MDTHNLPTKKNLLLARQHLALARKGYELLDKKTLILGAELSKVQSQANQVKADLHIALKNGHIALSIANMEMGLKKVQEMSDNIPKTSSTKVLFRSIMGVDLPLVNSENDYTGIKYSLHDTTASFDNAVLAWEEALKHIISWAAIENTIRSLKSSIKKTQKRANALGNIAIPKYMARIKYIEEQLEERERDELARLKLVKGRLQSQRHP